MDEKTYAAVKSSENNNRDGHPTAAHEETPLREWPAAVLLSRLALVHSEISEAVEAVVNNDLAIRFDENGKPEGATIEVADAVIRCFDLSAGKNMPIAEAIAIKHEYNEGRPHKHGGRLA